MSNDAPACKNCGHVDQGHTCGFLANSTPDPKDKSDKASDKQNKEEIIVGVLALVIPLIIFGPIFIAAIVDYEEALHPPRPSFFIRVLGTEGFDPNASVPVPPIFHLAVDVDGVAPHYNACSGDGKSMLQVSYHGMILAWGNVPHFCVNGNLIQQRKDCVVTIEAKAEGVVLREEIRSLVWSEQQAIGKTEFDLEGDVTGLGSLSCKVFYSNGQSTDSRTLCVIH